MRNFVDASVLVAMLTNETDAARWRSIISAADGLLTSPIATWEAVRAVSRVTKTTVQQSLDTLQAFCRELEIETMSIGADEARGALVAHERYGRGNHEAKLNMGDCFAYACANSIDAKLLYKGNDFAKTDLA